MCWPVSFFFSSHARLKFFLLFSGLRGFERHLASLL
ncbi:hypothetical protein PANA5342_2871 [Pantoea ananatis LMG 5342]|nr:hypothetical protein PANA5342_2871 [Pantoea ananatis LMG 5342]